MLNKNPSFYFCTNCGFDTQNFNEFIIHQNSCGRNNGKFILNTENCYSDVESRDKSEFLVKAFSEDTINPARESFDIIKDKEMSLSNRNSLNVTEDKFYKEDMEFHNLILHNQISQPKYNISLQTISYSEYQEKSTISLNSSIKNVNEISNHNIINLNNQTNYNPFRINNNELNVDKFKVISPSDTELFKETSKCVICSKLKIGDIVCTAEKNNLIHIECMERIQKEGIQI